MIPLLKNTIGGVKMRQGFTQINNTIFDLKLKANEKLLLIYLSSHDQNFQITNYRIGVDLGFKFETIKKISASLLVFLKTQENNEFLQIIQRLEKIISPKTDISKIRYIQKRSYMTPKMDIDNSKNGVSITPKMESKNINKNTNKNINLEDKNTSLVKTEKKLTLQENIEKFKQDLKTNADDLIKLAGSRELLKIHYDYFLDYLPNKKGSYKNHLLAFKNAIRGNWAKVPRGSPQMSFKVQDELLKQKKEQDFEDKIQDIIKTQQEGQNGSNDINFFERNGL